MLRAYKVFLATACPQRDLVRTMKRLLACLALCASLSASAQDENCTILGVQELSALYSELSQSIDTIISGLTAASARTDSLEIIKVGDYSLYYNCLGTCKSFLGVEWSMMDMEGVAMHYDYLKIDMYDGAEVSAWVKQEVINGAKYVYPVGDPNVNPLDETFIVHLRDGYHNIGQDERASCYCTRAVSRQ